MGHEIAIDQSRNEHDILHWALSVEVLGDGIDDHWIQVTNVNADEIFMHHSRFIISEREYRIDDTLFAP